MVIASTVLACCCDKWLMLAYEDRSLARASLILYNKEILMDVKTRIRQFLSKTVAEHIDDEDDIFKLGVVHSLFAIQLVQFIEKEFSITAEREDLDIKNFCSIAALTDFVVNKLARNGSGTRDEHQTD